MRIGVLEPQDNPAIDTPKRYVSKTVAGVLVRRLVAKRISKCLIQMVVVKAISDFHIPAEKPKLAVVPTILPPRKPDWIFTAYPIRDDRTIYI